jgi:uncharacterized protein YcbK (DUF882 family)
MQAAASRRRFLTLAVTTSASLVAAPMVARAAILPPPPKPAFDKPRALRLDNLHTGETLRVDYWEGGRYLPDALQEAAYFLRDFRTEEVIRIDPALLDQIYRLRLLTGAREPFGVVSGYRSPATNAMLRKASTKVAKKSYHMKGQAIDLRPLDVKLHHLHRAALAMKAGGVGYYSRSNFIHLDSGPPRSW